MPYVSQAGASKLCMWDGSCGVTRNLHSGVAERAGAMGLVEKNLKYFPGLFRRSFLCVDKL